MKTQFETQELKVIATLIDVASQKGMFRGNNKHNENSTKIRAKNQKRWRNTYGNKEKNKI